jgi:hypothetical protein
VIPIRSLKFHLVKYSVHEWVYFTCNTYTIGCFKKRKEKQHPCKRVSWQKRIKDKGNYDEAAED